MRGETIRQDKILHEPNPLAELIGQISGSNCLVEIAGSNSWIKSIGQIHGSNPPAKRGQTRPAAGKPRRTHGHAYGQAKKGLGWTEKGQRKSRALWARLVMDWFSVILSDMSERKRNRRSNVSELETIDCAIL